MRTILSVPLADVGLVTDKASPAYDPRIESPLDEYQLAGFRQDGQLHPVALVTRENMAAIGIVIDSPYTPQDGRRRRQYCEAAGIPFIDGYVVEVKSLEQFLDRMLKTNVHREEETTEGLIQKAKRILAAGGTIDSLVNTLKRPRSTVMTLLQIEDETGTTVAPEIRAMIKTGELDMGAAAQVVGMPVAEQKAVAEKIQKVQVAQLAKGTSKRGDAATIKKNAKGDTIAVPTQDTVQKIKADVKQKAVPASVGTEQEKKDRPAAAASKIDKVLIENKLKVVPMLRKFQNPDESFIAGYEAALASLIDREPALPEGASYEELFRAIFPKQ